MQDFGPIDTLRSIVMNPLVMWLLLAILFFVIGLVTPNVPVNASEALSTTLSGTEMHEWTFTAPSDGTLRLSSQEFFVVVRCDEETPEPFTAGSSWSAERGQSSDLVITEGSEWSISGETVTWSFEPATASAEPARIVRFGPLGRDNLTQTSFFGLAGVCAFLWLLSVGIHLLGRSG